MKNKTLIVILGGDSGAYRKVQYIGKEITEKVKPKGIVIFSAHWQASKDEVEVNTSTDSDLIYDFYGFPKYMYEETFEHSGSVEIANKVLDLFGKNGIKAKPTKRSIDHGVWVPFKVAFDPNTNPLRCPIVQVSLYDNENPEKHYALGQALAPLREEGIVIIGSGMSVHNLRDLFRLRSDKPTDYAISFDEALKDAVTLYTGESRKQALIDICERRDARKAHPTFDHLFPIHIAAGAAGDDSAKRLYSNQVGSMVWGQFRFGAVE